MRADIVPGGIFPDYELTDHTKIRHKLSELQGIDPMILVLSRGHFCPKDHQQDLELAAFYPRIVAGYTRIVTISTDNILVSNDFRESVGAQWTFLSDAGRKVQKDLDIQEYTDPHNNPMIPHTLVLKPGLVSTVSTTAIGSGADRRSRICAAICARSPAKSAWTGTRPHLGSERTTRRGTAPCTTTTLRPTSLPGRVERGWVHDARVASYSSAFISERTSV